MILPNLPTLRLPIIDNGEYATMNDIPLELPTSKKFSISWPSDTPTSSTTSPLERPNPVISEGDSESSDLESGIEEKCYHFRSPSSTRSGHVKSPPSVNARSCTIPRFPRALSMPLPSQLALLKHPHRSDPSSPPAAAEPGPIPLDSSRLHEISVELADSVQTMIQTMLQISPPHLLDPTKEQLSACSLAVPTSSMSAMLTSMKNLNYISANMSGLCSQHPRSPGTEDAVGVESQLLRSPPLHTDFDVGEMLQSVGDFLSGVAAQAGVDLVLYHGGDIGMRHICVRGDENGVSYALSHVVRRVLETTQPGDSIELGLLLRTLDSKTKPLDECPPSPNVDLEDPLSCTIRISHKFGTDVTSPISAKNSASPSRPKPTFSTLLLRRLLPYIGASLTPDLPPPKVFKYGRTCDFTFTLQRASPSMTNTPIAGHRADDDPISGEPSIEQLTLLAEGLKGKRVVLHASGRGSFAQRLTSYLSAWGMDVSLVPPSGEAERPPLASPEPTITIQPPSDLLPVPNPKTEVVTSGSSKTDTTHALSPHPSFIFIDDDVEVLKDQLRILRSESPFSLSTSLRKKPSLASHHRPRSSPQLVHTTPQTSALALHPSLVVIVHFTSLSNYKVIKEVVQAVIASHAGSTAPVPEVMIIPKPAGPRRFLTALYTAIMKPVVDPFFSPIATTPKHPTVPPLDSFFHDYNGESSSARHPPRTPRPCSPRTNSGSSTMSVKDISELSNYHSSSPMTKSDGVDYFSETALKLGTNLSSGYVIQNPDGQPAGILFRPRQKSQRTPSAHSMERDKGHLQGPFSTSTEQSVKRTPSPLAISGGSTFAMSPLHTMIASPVPTSDRTAALPSARAAVRSSPRPSYESQVPGSSTPRRSRASTTDESAIHIGRQGDVNGKPSPAGNGVARKATPKRTMAVEGSALPLSPTAPSAMALASKKAKAAADGNIVPPISVLIVDDNPINQTILSAFMRKKGIRYDVASNGQEAVQKWKTGGFHLILMDIQMPVLDGIQATKEIRRLEQWNAAAGYPPGSPSSPLRTPLSDGSSTETMSSSSPCRSTVIIVALTASSLQSDRVAALAAGCNDFLTKPVSLLWLNNKIIEWGSIKALQMWDLRPDGQGAGAWSLATEQAAQARSVAERLHVPSRRSPSPSRKNSAGASGAVTTGGTSGTGSGWKNGVDGPVDGPSPPSPTPRNELAKDPAQGSGHNIMASKPIMDATTVTV